MFSNIATKSTLAINSAIMSFSFLSSLVALSSTIAIMVMK